MVDPLIQPPQPPQPVQPPNPPDPPGPKKRNWDKIDVIVTTLGIVIATGIGLATWLIPRQDALDFLRKLAGAQPTQGDVQTPSGDEEATPSSPDTAKEEPTVSPEEGTPQPPTGDTETGENGTEKTGAPEPAPEHPAEKEPTPVPGPTPAGEDPPEAKKDARTEETPNDLPVLPDDQDPEFQEGVVVVTARYVDPTGPRVRGELSLPRLPTDALLSRAVGKELVVHVRVDPEGRATVTEIDGPWLLEEVQQRFREYLERRSWIPGTDTSGEPRESEAVVVFSWKKERRGRGV